MWARGHFNRVLSRVGGGEEVESAIWMREKDKGKNRREKRRKEERRETQRPTSTHLMLPAGPGDADSTVLLIHPPSPTSYPIFHSQSLFLLPLHCFVCNAPICLLVL